MTELLFLLLWTNVFGGTVFMQLVIGYLLSDGESLLGLFLRKVGLNDE